jgi:thiamine biosynthesis lipoprotein
MGTVVSIILPAADSSLAASVESRIQELSNIITADCERISATSDTVEVSETTYKLLQRAERYISLSNNTFNPAINGIVRLYGFPEGPYSVPPAESVATELKKIRSNAITLTEADGRYYAAGNRLSIDLGAYAKGFIVDEVVRFLQEQGLESFLVNAGGDLYAAGMKSKSDRWKLGITDPLKEREYVQAVYLQDKALATSGVYERAFVSEDGRRISHLFDAVSGKPADKYSSLSVVADSTELADALATIYFLLPEAEIEQICKQYNTPVYLIRPDGSSRTLCGWNELI